MPIPIQAPVRIASRCLLQVELFEWRTLILNILVVTACSSDLIELNASLAADSHCLMLEEAQTPSDLLQANRSFDCVLLRISEGNEAEFRLLTSIKNRWPGKPIIAYGDNWQIPSVVQAIKLGAEEVCEFSRNTGDLSRALNRVLLSEQNREPQFADIIPKDFLQKLNSEEARILHLLVQGRTSKQVGATLNVSIRTIHYRKKELLRKLGAKNRSEAIEMIRVAAGGFLAGLGSAPELC